MALKSKSRKVVWSDRVKRTTSARPPQSVAIAYDTEGQKQWQMSTSYNPCCNMDTCTWILKLLSQQCPNPLNATGMFAFSLLMSRRASSMIRLSSGSGNGGPEDLALRWLYSTLLSVKESGQSENIKKNSARRATWWHNNGMSISQKKIL